MRKKQILLVFLAAVLVLPSFLVSAATSETISTTASEENNPASGTFTSKDEVVYAALSPNGIMEEIYVVNIFEVLEPGTIIDYGNYTSVKNLTNLSTIEQSGNKIELDAPEGKFFYQGNMKNERLPWNFAISYYLDGEEIDPASLPGKDGHVQIKIETTANEGVETTFYENYLLQISLTLDTDLFRNIEAEDASMANAGKNKQITFTGMPEEDGEFVVEADVTEFEMKGIEIAAVPYNMSFDGPDMDDMTGDMESLTDAIRQINEGVFDLNNGVIDLNSGVFELRNGSAEFQGGMTEINDASTELIDGSAMINEALATINEAVGENTIDFDFEIIDMSELEQLPNSLSQLANGIDETADVLASIHETYSEAYASLDEAMQNIPEYDISDEDIERLYESGVDEEIIDQLVETYHAARQASGTYDRLKEGLDTVDTRLGEMAASSKQVSEILKVVSVELESALEDMDLADITDSFTQLEEGMAELSSSYNEFHNGLLSYTNGVAELSNGYNELHSGIVQLSNGTDELESGVGELYDGTNELYESTNRLPDQMKEEIDKMIAEFDRSDFEPVSFVSADNNEINSVQFVIRTENISMDEAEETTEEEEEKSFWQKLWDLFFG
ncbi:X-X-X-Leu-X-X-Gly heptad repeat-containing protein [Evansella cellulosilytica]|nr:X-X-X-Leu-X-X-Gly heptad repeat-containing protein [Evansella cellulosilytica]